MVINRAEKLTDNYDIQTSSEGRLHLLLNLLDQELDKGVKGINVPVVEDLLSRVYKIQGKVINPSIKDLFILWEDFKIGHNPLFAKALAMLSRKRTDALNLPVRTIIGVPDSGTWMTKAFEDYFPEAQTVFSTKDSKLAGPNSVVINSLTYTERTEDDERMPVDIHVDHFEHKKGAVLVFEDVLATGKSAKLFLEGLEQNFGIENKSVVWASAVSMDVQEGLPAIANHKLVAGVCAPVRVTDVTSDKITTLY